MCIFFVYICMHNACDKKNSKNKEVLLEINKGKIGQKLILIFKITVLM